MVRRTWGLAVVLAAVGGQAQAPQHSKPVTATAAMAAQLFRWFDKYGVSDDLRGQIVRLERREWDSSRGPKTRGLLYAIKQQPAGGQVLYLDFDFHLRKRSDFTHVFEVSASEAMREELRHQESFRLKPPSWDEPWRQWTGPMPAMIWARTAALHGESDLSMQFMHQALRLAWGGPLLPVFQDQMGRLQIRRIIHSFADSRIPWRDQQRALERFCRLFPDDPSVPTCKWLIKAMDATVAADRSRKSREPIDMLIDELAHEDDPNMIDDWAGGAEGRLWDLGFRAMPKLIAALDDHRLTHCLEGSEVFQDVAAQVYSVKTRAIKVIQTLTGEKFGVSAYQGSPAVDAAIAAAKPRVQAWWNANGKQLLAGEKEMLVHQVEEGETFWKRRLAIGYPATFITTYRRMLRKMEPARRDEIAWHLMEMPREVVVPIATVMLKDEPSLATRLAAASLLKPYQPEVCLAAMMSEWERPRAAGDPNLYGVADYLLNTRSVAAVRAVRRHFGRLDAEGRSLVVYGWAPGSRFGEDRAKARDAILEARYGAYRDEVEALLVSALVDRAMAKSWIWPENEERGVWLPGRRVCDMAAATLARAFPKRYGGRILQSLWERDSRYRSMANSWRSAHRQPQLPLLQPYPIRPMPWVRVVTVGSGVPPGTRRAIEGWVGKPLSREAAGHLVQTLLSELPAKTSRVKLLMNHDGSGSGLEVTLECLAASPSLGSVWSYGQEWWPAALDRNAYEGSFGAKGPDGPFLDGLKNRFEAAFSRKDRMAMAMSLDLDRALDN
jgi:hypothetical protein